MNSFLEKTQTQNLESTQALSNVLAGKLSLPKACHLLLWWRDILPVHKAFINSFLHVASFGSTIKRDGHLSINFLLVNWHASINKSFETENKKPPSLKFKWSLSLFWLFDCPKEGGDQINDLSFIWDRKIWEKPFTNCAKTYVGLKWNVRGGRRRTQPQHGDKQKEPS